jgi:hypothetical protein
VPQSTDGRVDVASRHQDSALFSPERSPRARARLAGMTCRRPQIFRQSAQGRALAVLGRASMVALLLVAASSCRTEKERELGREITRLAHLINQLRDASNAGKSTSLAQLESAQCSEAEACQLQQVCVQAYQLQVKSMNVAERVKQALTEGASEQAVATQLLAASEKDLKLAHDLMLQCVELQGDLERRYVAKR